MGWKCFIWFHMKHFQAFLSLAMSLLTFLSFRLLLITSFHVFYGCPLGKRFRLWRFYIYWAKYFLSRWPNHCSLLSSKHSLMLFNFSLVLSSSAEILSGLMLFVHLTILASFLFSLLTSSSLISQVSLPYCIRLHTHAEYIVCLLFLKANLYWRTKALNLWIYIVNLQCKGIDSKRIEQKRKNTL